MRTAPVTDITPDARPVTETCVIGLDVGTVRPSMKPITTEQTLNNSFSRWSHPENWAFMIPVRGTTSLSLYFEGCDYFSADLLITLGKSAMPA